MPFGEKSAECYPPDYTKSRAWEKPELLIHLKPYFLLYSFPYSLI